MHKHQNSFAHIAIYALAGLIVVLALRSARSDGGVDDRPPGGRMIDGWRQVAAGGHWLGPRDASVVIIEFGDYECPSCRSAHGILRSLRQAFSEDLAIVYRHYPLEAIHPQAYFAARLAECGAQQAAFEATHNYLFELDRLDTISVPDLVASTGISNPQQFADCANSTQSVLGIELDRGAADVLGIARTPSFIVQGMLLHTTPDSIGWFQLIAAHIKGESG